ncbi:hypothetical protein D3C81_1174020 [compost metagenome]
MEIKQLVQESHQNAVSKGWWDEDRSFGEIIVLIHSEVSEALEDYRNGRSITEVWYENKDFKTRLDSPITPDCKPCGIPSELADICIRVFDACGKYGWGDRLEVSATESMERCLKSDGRYNSFPERLNSIHYDLSQAWINYEKGNDRIAMYCLGHVLNGVRNVAAKYRIDLDQAIVEKMAYNTTRPQRHGGKKI